MPPGLSCLKMCPNRVPVAHACNPSYSGDRDQEDHGSNPAQANSSSRSYLKKPSINKGWWNALRRRPWIQKRTHSSCIWKGLHIWLLEKL
jgi:hypothetical protein